MQRHNQTLSNKEMPFFPTSAAQGLHTCIYGFNPWAPALMLTAHDREEEVTGWLVDQA